MQGQMGVKTQEKVFLIEFYLCIIQSKLQAKELYVCIKEENWLKKMLFLQKKGKIFHFQM